METWVFLFLNLFLSYNERIKEKEGGRGVITLMVTIVIFSLIFWALCELISAAAGLIFIIVAMIFVLKLAKEIFK